MALGPGLPTRMVCPSPLLRTTSMVPMVPPPPDRFSTMADWPHAVCRCAASSRPITSVVPPAAAGTIRRTVSVGRQSPAPRLARGKMATVDSAAAPVSTRRRETSLVVTFHSLLGYCFGREPRQCRAARQAGDLAQATAQGPCFDAFSLREPVSTSLENALVEAKQLEQRCQ